MIINTELLVRRVDKIAADPIENLTVLKRGDVVTVCQYPWNWSDAEINNPNWIIVQSDMTMEEASTYIQPQPGDPRVEPGLKLRNKRINLDSADVQIPIKYPVQAGNLTPPFNKPFKINKQDIFDFSEVKLNENPFQI